MASEPPYEKILDYNLKYFEIHAAQRLTIFNFYIVLSGATLAGMAATAQGSSRYSLAGCILGIMLVAISFIFWKLDVRTGFLIKHAEDVLVETEKLYIPPYAQIFSTEPTKRKERQASSNMLNAMFTYSQLFKTMFVFAASLGLTGAMILGLRAVGVLDWNEASAIKSTNTPAHMTTIGIEVRENRTR